MSRILAIDYGRKRVGLAISDESKTISYPLDTIELSEKESIIQKLSAEIKKYSITEIVIGNPLRADSGGSSELSAEIEQLCDRIVKDLGIEVHLVKEWYSSVEAERILKDSGERDLKKRKLVDKLSASLILDNYLESLRNE